MRLIDADKLIERAKKIYCPYCAKVGDECKNEGCAAHDIEDLIAEAPSENIDTYRFTFTLADPDPTRRGKYVKFTGTYESARQMMLDRFGERWAFQYSSAEWIDVLERANSMGYRIETELLEDEK